MPNYETFPIEIESATEISNPPTAQSRRFLVQTIKSHFLFRGINNLLLDFMISKLRFLIVPKDTIAIKQGDPGNYFYILNTGRFEILVNGIPKTEKSRGDCFGELALITKTLRNFTIKTLEKCTLWAIDRTTFKETIRKIFNSNIEQVKKSLFNNPFFAMIKESQKKKLVQKVLISDYVDGEVIINQGEVALFAYIVNSGSVKFLVNGEDKGYSSKGQVFGENCLFSDNLIRQATVISIGNTQLISLDRESIIEVFGDDYKTIFFKNIVLNSLLSDSLLKLMEKDVLQELVPLFSINVRKAGDVIIHSKEKVYVVCYGKISCSTNSYGNYQCIGLGNENEKKIANSEYVCDVDTTIAEVLVTDIQKCLGFSESTIKKVLKNAKFFKSIDLFSDLNFFMLYKLLLKKQRNNYKKNDIIFKEGDNDYRIFILKQGNVSKSQGKKIISILEPPATFGESCLKLNTRINTIKALNDVVSYTLIRKDFLEIVSPNVISKIQKKHYLEIPFEIKDLIRLSKLKKIGDRNYTVMTLPSKNYLYMVEEIQKKKVTNTAEFNQIIEQKNILSKIDYQFIPKLIKTCLDTKKVYFVYEHLEYEPLSIFKGEKVNEPSIKFIVVSLAIILNYLSSKNIIHRDLSQDSIIIDKEGYIWLWNFRYSKIIQDRTYTVFENYFYQSREIILGRGYTKDSDYWSLGVILYELLTGKFPFGVSEDDPVALVAEKIINTKLAIPTTLNPAIQKVLNGILNEDRDERFLYDEITSSDWLRSMDLKRISSRTLKSPLIRTIEDLLGSKKTSNTNRIVSLSDLIEKDEYNKKDFNWNKYF